MTIKYRFKTWDDLYKEQADPLGAFCHIMTLQESRYNAYKAFKENHQYIKNFTPRNTEEIDAAADYLFKGYHVCNWNKNGVCYIEYEEDNKND